MSAEQTSQLPDEQTAYATIIEGVDKRAFFHKMAQLGYVPETAEEAESLYSLSFKVAAMSQQQGQGQEKKGSNRFAEAGAALDKMAGAAPPPSDEASQIAFEFAHDPAIYGSALVLKAAQARAWAELEAAQ